MGEGLEWQKERCSGLLEVGDKGEGEVSENDWALGLGWPHSELVALVTEESTRGGPWGVRGSGREDGLAFDLPTLRSL